MTDIDALCNSFDYNTSIIWKPTEKFINDLNLIIEEISSFINLYNLDIYEVCVSCGNNLTWDQEYYISQHDYNWLNADGKTYFFKTINSNFNISQQRDLDINEYRILYAEFNKLVELFSLQIGD